jgi:Ca2+/Na+ antiporter
MLYAVIYGYIGISIVIVDQIHRDIFLLLTYFILTSLLVIGLIFMISRKFKEDE